MTQANFDAAICIYRKYCKELGYRYYPAAKYYSEHTGNTVKLADLSGHIAIVNIRNHTVRGARK